MVIESHEKSPHLDEIFITPPPPSQSQQSQLQSSSLSSSSVHHINTSRLSWKFFDNFNLQLPDDQKQDEVEDNTRHKNYAADLTSTEGLLMISNSTLYKNQRNKIMNSSISNVAPNHNHHSNNTGINNTGSNTGLLRSGDTVIGDGHGTGSSHHIRHGLTGLDSCTGGGGGDADSGVEGNTGFYLGLHGWRKKCLYILILGLMVLIIVNLILTLWILKVMEFSSEGMGQLKVVAGGIQLSGQALVLDLLRASTIRSRHGQPISIESSRNFSINTRDSDGQIENHLFLGHDKLECLATEFRINDTHGKNLFSVNRNEVTIGAHTLRIDGQGGAVFQDSIQTSHVRAEAGSELKLESPTRKVEINAGQDLNLQSRAGNVDLNALKDVKLNSVAGSIRLESSQILLPNIKTAQQSVNGIPTNHEHHKVYQLCACYNGKLFLALPHSICAGDDVSICR